MTNFWKSFFASLLAIIVSVGFMFLFGMVLIVAFISMLADSGSTTTTIKEHSILKIDLSTPVVERALANPIDLFDYSNMTLRRQTTTLDAVSMIGHAANDPRIDGIYISIPMSIPSSISVLYELRQALEEFRESGKFVVAYGDVYTQSGYYLASVADRVMLNPEGSMDWSGLSSNVLFFKGLLDKLGVKPELIRHGRYKSAGEPFMRDSLSDENREQIGSMLNSLWGQIVGQIAESRSLDADSLNSYATQLAVASALDAQRLGLVDSLYYRDQMREHLCRITSIEEDKDPRLISMSQYKQAGKSLIGKPESANKIAILYADGDMVDVGDKNSQIVGNSLAGELSKIRRDDDIKAVVIRVNSPGGSALAAEVIAREVELTADAKPVVISMSSYAASGGYYISAPADLIVTTPVTLTGSIGVFGILFDASAGAKDKLGISVQSVSTNPSAGMGSIMRPLSNPERQFIQRGVDRVYGRFSQVVAQGRHMSADSVEALASGRVWTGDEAVRNGLADRHGSFSDAIQAALDLAGIASPDFAIVSYPETSESSLDIIFGSIASRVKMSISGAMSDELGEELVTEARKAAELMKAQGIRAQMPFEIEIIK